MLELKHIPAVVLLACASCSDVTDVSGLWQTPKKDEAVVFQQFDPPFQGRLRMGLGQYGSDVAGVFLFFGDDLYYDERVCSYILEGGIRGDEFLFSLRLDETTTLEGSLEYREEDRTEFLEGDLTDANDVVAPLHVVLEKVGDSREVRVLGLDEGCKVD